MWLSLACAPRQGATRPAAPTAASAAPTTSEPAARESTAAPAQNPPTRILPRRPKRPAITWTKFIEAFDAEADADIVSRWTGGKRLEVHTENVRKLLIDFRELPRGAPKRGSWNLQIDEQGIEVTGRRGPLLELTRLENGSWTVTGPKPRRRR
ncbi:MAG: hypothetical protein V3T70_04605 [Phycisphaerae bacterium]